MSSLPIPALLIALPLLASADPPAGAQAPDTERAVLADFEQAAAEDALRPWQSRVDARPGDGVSLAIETVERNGKPQRALRMVYRMPPEDGGQHGIDATLKLDGIDASQFDHLRFSIKGDAGAGFNHQLEAGFRRPHGGEGLADVARYRVSDIGPDWQQVVIPLNQMIGISDWRGLTEFSLSLLGRDTRVPQGAYLIDDIELIRTGDPGPSANDQVVAVKKTAWEQARGGGAAARAALRERLVGWPQQALIDAKTLPADDREFLLRLARDTWRGIDALSDDEHGLPLDRVHFKEGSVAIDDAYIGDYTSTTNIGFHLLAVTAAQELRFIGRDDALARLRDTLTSLERMETYQGFFYNYYNTTTLERTSNFISFVDSGWLTAGLMVVRNAFPELAERCSQLIRQGDYRFFYDGNWNLMSHGFYVNLGQRTTFHYGSLYSEARLGSLIAIGKGDAPEQHWFAMHRTFPNDFTWQTLQPLARHDKSGRGFQWTGGYYQWKDLRYVPSWGGSLFEALMPALLLDEMRYAPDSLGRNDKVHTEIHRRHALEDLDYPVWGMSPSSAPDSDQYREYGVHFLGSLGYPEGAVTSHAAALALLTEPEAATVNLRLLAQRYPLYGDFGFYDAVDPRTGKVAYKYLCLNQAMILVALADHLADHAIQKHFAADPIMQKVLPLIGFENFVD